MSRYYEYDFLKDKTACTPPSLQDSIIGELLCEIAHQAHCRDGGEYIAKWDLELKRAVLVEKSE
jgi:hypothetical protein